MNYIIGSTKVSLDGKNNSTKTASIKAISPDASGNIVVKMIKDVNAAYALINAIVFQSYANPKTASPLNTGLGLVKTSQTSLSPIMNSINGDWIVYPNPFHQDLNINLNSLTEGKYKVSLLDIQGKIVYRESFQFFQVGQNFRTIQSGLEALPNGIYLLRLESDTFPLKSIKIIKR